MSSPITRRPRGLILRVVPCGLSIRSDPRLLEQMIRNLLSNALKYTRHGKVLLGCRRHEGQLSIEVWDTGIGIPDDELQAIFEEYHQIDNAARERSRGLGLGLSIVHRLGAAGSSGPGALAPGQGFGVFHRGHPAPAEVLRRHTQPLGRPTRGERASRHIGAILVVEDDPDVRELLEAFLKDEGHEVRRRLTAIAALDLVAGGNGAAGPYPRGLQSAERHGWAAAGALIREELHHPVPAIILTGDISTDTAEQVALQDCVQLNKPVKLKELTQAIHVCCHCRGPRFRRGARAPAEALGGSKPPVIFVVDDDDSIRGAIRAVLEDDDRK